MARDSGFDAIVAKNHAEIYQYLLRLTGRTPVADDLSQQTFLRAYRPLPPDTDARARLFSIATNLSWKYLRGKGRRHLGQGLAGVGTRAGMPGAIEAAVTLLPFKERAAFLQRKLHLLDYAAIGQSLQCSIESARTLVFHALQRIRQALDGQQRGASQEIDSTRRRRRRPGDGPRGSVVRERSGEPVGHGGETGAQ